jgi:hypothetical protein
MTCVSAWTKQKSVYEGSFCLRRYRSRFRLPVKWACHERPAGAPFPDGDLLS